MKKLLLFIGIIVAIIATLTACSSGVPKEEVQFNTWEHGSGIWTILNDTIARRNSTSTIYKLDKNDNHYYRLK